MTVLAALLFAVSPSVSGGTAPTLLVHPGPLVRLSTEDGCFIWEGSVQVQANLPWLLEVNVTEPCGPSVAEWSGPPTEATTLTYRIGTHAEEPIPYASVVALP